MPPSIKEFWKLAITSGLMSLERAKELHATFRGAQAADQQADTLALSEWLVAHGALTPYQASLLVAGRPGPFVFGDYVISERIESGRLNRLFRASYQGTQPVLLVFTAQLPGLAEWPEVVAEYSQAAMAIKSPHVLRVRQFVEGPPHSFTVLEDLRGQSLRERLGTKRAPLEQACRIAFQAALGLVAIHEQQRAQGRLAPEHLWLDQGGSIKVLQFPLAPVALPPERLELPLADYLAPELRCEEEVATAQSDIYALGCTLFELIAGHVPFPGGSAEQKLARHAAEVPRRLDQLVPGVPEELADLVAEMLDKEPILRCQSASQVAHLLAPFADDVGTKGRRAGPPRMDDNAATPGYGVWQAPTWQSPPQQVAPARPAAQSARKEKPSATPVKASPVKADAAKAGPANARPIPATTKPSASPPDSLATSDSAWPGDDQFAPPAEAAWQVPLVTGRPGGAGAKPAKAGMSKQMLVAAGVGLALLVLTIVAALLLLNRDSPVAVQLPPTVAAGSEAETGAAEAQPAASPPKALAQDMAPGAEPVAKPPTAASREIEDDGKTLWAAPARGEPLTLRYLPSSSQVFIVLRLADLLANAEGAKWLDALGPAGELAKNQLRATLGVDLAEVEQLSVAFYPDDVGAPRAAYAMQLRNATPATALVEAWDQPAAKEHKSKKFFQGASLAYYLPDEAEGRVAVIGETAAIQEIIERDGPPLLRKGIERLLKTSDSTRQVNLLFAPSYLLTDGRGLLIGDLEKLHDPLAAFLDESIQAVLLSVQLGDSLFLECRAVGSADKPAAELARLLQARLERVSEQVEIYVASLEPNPYGRLVVNRFPRMVQLLAAYTRGGVEEKQAVLRCYLPLHAGHNLLLGAELTLFEQPATGGVAANRPVASAPADVRAALGQKISLSFPRETLERCLELLAKELDVEIVILGADLQLEGITKNQSFGLDERQQPAGEILARVLRLANPAGKLVYVIRPQAGGREAIFITTRNAASKRGEPLPAEFDPKTGEEQP